MPTFTAMRNPISSSPVFSRWSLAVLAVAVMALTGCSASPTPEELAVDVLPAVEKYLAEIDPEGQVRAVLVLHDGEPVVEHYVDSAAEDYWDRGRSPSPS